jgi:hypothetical protein
MRDSIQPKTRQKRTTGHTGDFGNQVDFGLQFSAVFWLIRFSISIQMRRVVNHLRSIFQTSKPALNLNEKFTNVSFDVSSMRKKFSSLQEFWADV